MKLALVTAIALLLLISWAPGASAAPRYTAERTGACLAANSVPFEEVNDFYYDGLVGQFDIWFAPNDNGEHVFFARREATAVRLYRNFRHYALETGLTAAQVRDSIGRKRNVVWGPNVYTAAEAKQAIAFPHVGHEIRRCLR